MTDFFGFILQIRVCRWIGLAALWALLMPLSLDAQTSKSIEYQTKAAYLHSFIRFVTWPASATVANTNAITICVLGDDPFGAQLEAAGAGLVIDGKRTIVSRVSTAEAGAKCDVLFISLSGHPPLEQIIAAVGKRAVLTVSDMPDFTRLGGIIQFVREGSRIRFEVNLAAAGEAGLTLSSELLKVARAVRRAP